MAYRLTEAAMREFLRRNGGSASSPDSAKPIPSSDPLPFNADQVAAAFALMEAQDRHLGQMPFTASYRHLKSPPADQRDLTRKEAWDLHAYATAMAPEGTPGRKEAIASLKSSPVPPAVIERLLEAAPVGTERWYVSEPWFLKELKLGLLDGKLGIPQPIRPTGELRPDPRPYEPAMRRFGEWLGLSTKDVDMMLKVLGITPIGAVGHALDASAMGDFPGTVLNTAIGVQPFRVAQFGPELNAALSLLRVGRAGRGASSVPWPTRLSRYFSDPRSIKTISKEYWNDMQAAQWRSLAHIIPRRWKKYLPERFLNGGWNMVLMPRLIKSKVGGFNQWSGMSRSPLARAAEIGFAGTLLGTRAVAGYGLLRYIQDLYDKAGSGKDAGVR